VDRPLPQGGRDRISPPAAGAPGRAALSDREGAALTQAVSAGAPPLGATPGGSGPALVDGSIPGVCRRARAQGCTRARTRQGSGAVEPAPAGSEEAASCN